MQLAITYYMDYNKEVNKKNNLDEKFRKTYFTKTIKSR